MSADLTELGRTPVTVACAGAKSILDLPLTLEYLETQGVPVYGWCTDTFPAFYTASSGLPVPHRCASAAQRGPACAAPPPALAHTRVRSVDSEGEVAAAMRAGERLGLSSGAVLAIPNAAEVDEAEIERATATAVREAEQRGVTGKEATPFLLQVRVQRSHVYPVDPRPHTHAHAHSHVRMGLCPLQRITELTEGRSLDANIALLLNNAHVGARVASAHADLRRGGASHAPSGPSANTGARAPSRAGGGGSSVSPSQAASVLVVGGALMDTVSWPAKEPLQLGTSNPGQVKTLPGGATRPHPRLAPPRVVARPRRRCPVCGCGRDCGAQVSAGMWRRRSRGALTRWGSTSSPLWAPTPRETPFCNTRANRALYAPLSALPPRRGRGRGDGRCSRIATPRRRARR